MDNYYEQVMGPLEEALDELVQPDVTDLRCYAYAIDLYKAYDRFGLPESGGWAEQDSFDMYVLDCMLTARERAEREKSASRAAEADAMRSNEGGN